MSRKEPKFDGDKYEKSSTAIKKAKQIGCYREENGFWIATGPFAFKTLDKALLMSFGLIDFEGNINKNLDALTGLQKLLNDDGGTDLQPTDLILVAPEYNIRLFKTDSDILGINTIYSDCLIPKEISTFKTNPAKTTIKVFNKKGAPNCVICCIRHEYKEHFEKL